MANQSGTLTSSNGFLTITGSPNDTLTITPTAGTFTLEYPLGTILASGVSATTTYAMTAGGQARLMCITGSVAYSLTDNPDGYALTQAQAGGRDFERFVVAHPLESLLQRELAHVGLRKENPGSAPLSGRTPGSITSIIGRFDPMLKGRGTTRVALPTLR